MTDQSPPLKPRPRRPFDLPPTPSDTSEPPTPDSISSPNTPQTDNNNNGKSGGQTPSRTRSFLNLTSSTLSSIYSPTENAPTPSGSGARTPNHRNSVNDNLPPVLGVFQKPEQTRKAQQQHRHHRHRPSIIQQALPIFSRTLLLFILGVAYGIIIIQLHDSKQIAPVELQNISRYSPRYLLLWGTAGVVLGRLLPWIDWLWERASTSNGDVDASTRQNGEKDESSDVKMIPARRSRTSSYGVNSAVDWTSIVRSIGAFIGIAFAIRRLPWQSTLQLSLTLALVNPVLWYLIDRSKPGFTLSTIVGVAGTILVLAINPEIVPSPALSFSSAAAAAAAKATTTSSVPISSSIPLQASAMFDEHGKLSMRHRFVNDENIGVSTWIASVLFCSSVCFGNIGRRLLAGEGEGVRSW